MQNSGGCWSLKGPDPCAVGVREADPEMGDEERVAGDDEEGRSASSQVDPWHPRLLGIKETWR